MQTAKILTLCGVMGLAHASPLPLPTQGNNELTIAHLEAIQAQTVLYEAQVLRARALQELQKNGGEVDSAKPFNPAPPADIPVISSQSLPQIIQISGTGKSISALLILGNGNQVTVSQGSDIPGTAWQVSKITLNQVIVTSGDKARTLNFSG